MFISNIRYEHRFFLLPLILLPLLSAVPIQDVNIHNANGIGGNNTSAPIGKTDQICMMNTLTIETSRIFLGSTWRHLFKVSIRCANILAELYPSWEEHFVPALHICEDIAY